MRKIKIYLFILVSVLFLGCQNGNVVMNYHMDECELNADNNIVKDYSDVQNDAIAKHGPQNTDGLYAIAHPGTNEVICGNLEFRGEGYNADPNNAWYVAEYYLEAPDNYYISPLANNNEMSMSGWFKTSKKLNNDMYLIDKPWEYGIYIKNGDLKFIIWNKNQNSYTGTIKSNVADGKWHFYAVTADVSTYISGYRIKKRLTVNVYYGDGTSDTLEKTTYTFNNFKGAKNTGNNLYIGAMNWNGNVTDYFDGYLDELGMLDVEAGDSYIYDLYEAQKNHEDLAVDDWGDLYTVKRTCPECKTCPYYTGDVTPIEFEGGEVTLSNTYKERGKWDHITFQHKFSTTPVVFMVIDTNGGDPASVRIKNVTTTGFDAAIVEPPPQDGPHISQKLNYLAINKGVHKLGGTYIEVGTINTKKVQGKYAPSGNDIGWDEVKPKVQFCNPAVVANIQTLNNLDAGKNPPKTNLTPWGTAVLKINDDKSIDFAIDMSETGEGVFTQDETIGYMIGEGNFTGSFTDGNGKKVEFEIIKTGPYFVGWSNGCKKVKFQNSYTQTPIIAGWKDSRIGSDGGWFRRCYLDNKEIGFVVDEDKDHDGERQHTPEEGGIFAFSSPFVINENNQTNYRFDAWDDNKNINEKILTTKLINQNFTVTLASLDETGNDYQEFNGTVCSRIVGDGYEGAWNKTVWNNEKEKNVTFNVNMPLRSARVNIHWINDNLSANCPLQNETNETNSSDAFAIRPAYYKIDDVNKNLKAGADFSVLIKAYDANKHVIGDFNFSNAPVEFDFKDSMGCKTGELNSTPSPLKTSADFVNGEANVTLNYTEVGDLNISVKEYNNSSEFASVDEKQENNTTLLIGEGNSTVKHFNPYKFEINATYENYKDGNFTYYDGDLNITSHLDLNITAKNKENKTTENYNKKCYAKDIDINISHNSVDVDVNDILYKYKDASGVIHGIFSVDKDNDVNITYSKDNFDGNGTARIDVYFNFDRNSSVVLNPFEFNITDIDVNDTDANGTLNLNETARYYYGNLLLSDVLAVQNDFNKTYSFVVYDDNESDTLKPDSKEIAFNWYENIYHRKIDGNVSSGEIVVSSDYNASHNINNNMEKVSVNVSQDNNGQHITFEINRKDSSVRFAVIHLLSPNLKWLWYSKFYEKYDVSKNSSCLNHFCFAVSWQNTNSEGEVGSGEFNGTEANVTDTNSTKRGVKIFR